MTQPIETAIRRAIENRLLDASITGSRVYTSLDRQPGKDDLPCLVIWEGDTRIEPAGGPGRNVGHRAQKRIIEIAISCVEMRREEDRDLAQAEDRAAELGARVQEALLAPKKDALPENTRLTSITPIIAFDPKNQDMICIHRVLAFEIETTTLAGNPRHRET